MGTVELWNRGRTSPTSLFDEMFSRLNDFDLGVQFPRGVTRTGEAFLSPACDISETKEGYLLAFDLPGIRKEDISIEVSGRGLVVSGEKKREEEHKEGNLYRSERSYGRFSRSFDLPEGANLDQIEASYENGVLRVAVPKSEAKKARKVEIGETSKGFLSKLVGKSE